MTTTYQIRPTVNTSYDARTDRNFILREDGFFLLREDWSKFLREESYSIDTSYLERTKPTTTYNIRPTI